VATDPLLVHVFDLPRDGYHTCVSIKSLLATIGITRQKKSLGNYIVHQWHSYVKTECQFGLHGLQRPTRYHKQDGPEREADGDDVVSERSASPAVVLVLLSKWAFATKQGGGFDDPDVKLNASDLLTRLVNRLASTGPFESAIVDDRDAYRLPSGVISADIQSKSARIRVDTNGMVSFNGMNELAKRGCVNLCLAKLKENVGDPVHVVDVVRWIVVGCSNRMYRDSASLQIIWRLGEMCDTALTNLISPRRGKDTLSCIVPSETEMTPTRRIALYHQATAQLGTVCSMQFISHAPDKARVKQRGIMNGLYALPGNIAVWGTPQDRSWVSGVASPGQSLKIDK
jgi:hypothetical protein